MIYSYNEILLNNKGNEIHNHVNKSQKHYAEYNKAGKTESTYKSIYTKFYSR